MILFMADALDFQIINALQIHPRVSWAQLSKVLAVDASTISRRWSALISERRAWMTCYDSGAPKTRNGGVSALVEVRCVSGRRSEVIEELASKPPIFSVNCTSGSRDLFVLISTLSLVETDRYVDEHIASIPGIIATQTHYLRKVFFEGSSWRLQALSQAQVKSLENLRPSAKNVERKAAYEEIIRALQTDARRTAADVQAETGRSIAVVARDIDAVLSADWVRWQVDFAQQLMGWSAAAVLWLNVNRTDQDRVVDSLTRLNQARFCALVTGKANLAVLLWLHDLEELDNIEHRITAAYPHIEIHDRWIVPRIAKRLGHILDVDSSHLRFVPLDGGDNVLED
ncbi:AsnC family transcriptional regulator [Arthrobacter sp. StoSoilB5]|nr:AsnC family transcriptional regulator [Arthrobacter sp. StoSoilB5]